MRISPLEYSPPIIERVKPAMPEQGHYLELLQQFEYLKQSYHAHLNYANFMTPIISRTHHPLNKHINLINCAVDCGNFTDETERYISTGSDKLTDTKFSRMLSEETDPPPELYDAVKNGDFRKFGGLVYNTSTEAGFRLILYNIDSFSKTQALVKEIRLLVDSDPFISDEERRILCNYLKYDKTGKDHETNRTDAEALFLFECFKYTLDHGNNAYMRKIRDQIRLIKKEAKRLTALYSKDAAAFYAEEILEEESALSSENGIKNAIV